jgi:ABC-type multidrug transport system fused ATPase/permease subunit
MNKINYSETFQNLKRTWKYARKNKKTLFSYLIFTVLLSIIGAILPIITAKVLINITSGNFKELIIISGIIFVIEISRNIISYFSSKMSQIFYRETLVDIQSAITKETIKLEAKVIDQNSSGVFIDRLNKDSTDLADIFSWINWVFGDIISNLGVLFAVFIISKEIFIYFIVGIIILFTFQKIRMKAYFARDKKYRELTEKNTGLITELIRGLKDIKLLNANKTFSNKTFDKLRESNKERYLMSKITNKYNFLIGSIKDLLSLGFIIISVFLVNQSLLAIPNFVILYMYQSKVYNLLNSFSQLLETIKKFNLSSKRVFEIIEGDIYSKEIFGDKKLKRIEGNFEFKNVTFAYNNEMPVLKNISFKIKANETVAFVGKSGSGKTTIFSLLTKLYNIKNGEILIDGNNINDLSENSIRGNISIITQNPYIFNFSIRENLNIVKENLTDEEMIEACKLARIHDYIMGLPEKYDTIVGEGGLILSGGQRQRLAIARALIKKTEIILFDEATSALDNETQSEIQKAINNMKRKYTILIIAHRLSTVIESDRIIVMNDGKIISEGTHKQLLEKCKIYKKLYETELSLDK